MVYASPLFFGPPIVAGKEDYHRKKGDGVNNWHRERPCARVFYSQVDRGEKAMSTVASLKVSSRDTVTEWQMRVDLAACFRIAADMGWHEAVANHFSLAVSPGGKRFLMNPR